MNEPICLARKRKDKSWVILSSPDKSFAEANTAFNDNATPVHKEYDMVIIGKVTHTRPAQNPLSAEQNEARMSAIVERNKRVEEIAGTARARAAKIDEDKNIERQKQHETELARKKDLVSGIRKSTNYKEAPVPAAA